MTVKTDKLIVGFDMDGVILDNSDSKIEVAKKFGLKVKLNDTPSEILKTLMPKATWEKFKNTLYDHPKFAYSTPLMKGVRGILDELSKKNISCFLISKRTVPGVAIKILEKHLLWPKYFNEKNSFFVTHPGDKDIKAAQLGITHYIDDELKVVNVLSSVPNRFLFDKFDVFKNSNQYIKVRSWSEFRKHLNLK